MDAQTHGCSYRPSCRRTRPSKPTTPEPNNISVPGSGVAPVVVVVPEDEPNIVNDSD